MDNVLQCSGLCWFHGKLSKEQISLRLAITEPVTGSFLVTNSQSREAIYILNVWNNNKVSLVLCPVLNHYFHSFRLSDISSVQIHYIH